MTAWPSTNMSTELKIGDPAPDFKATAVGGIYGGGQEVKFADFADSTLVLYFYPEDDTPGCTKQACDFRDSWRELQSKVVLRYFVWVTPFLGRPETSRGIAMKV